MSSLKEIQALQLQSEKVFDYFEEICAIPHGSRNTKAISDYLVAFAKKHDLTWYQDESNNVVIVQEATAGYEQADTIILQDIWYGNVKRKAAVRSILRRTVWISTWTEIS